MLRNIVAALAGYIFIGVLIASTDKLYSLLIPGFSAMTRPPDWYFVISMTTDTVFTLFGGWLCAKISRASSQATMALIILGELAGVAATFFLWNKVPHFYSFFLLISYPPAVWLGAKIPKSTIK